VFRISYTGTHEFISSSEKFLRFKQFYIEYIEFRNLTRLFLLSYYFVENSNGSAGNNDFRFDKILNSLSIWNRLFLSTNHSGLFLNFSNRFFGLNLS